MIKFQKSTVAALMPKTHFFRYLIVGSTAYLSEITTLYVFHRIIGLSSIKSVAISYWVGLTVAFTLQKLVTFQNRDKRIHVMASQMAGFALLVIWNYLFTLITVKLLSDHISVFVLRTAIILITTSWNFMIYKKLFKQTLKV